MRMKPDTIFIIAISCFLGATIVPMPAKALPFKKSCNSMQSYFNSQKWKDETKVIFQGFQSKTFEEVFPEEPLNHRYRCASGYITEISPMGTFVCTGDIGYWAKIDKKSYIGNSDCRWK